MKRKTWHPNPGCIPAPLPAWYKDLTGLCSLLNHHETPEQSDNSMQAWKLVCRSVLKGWMPFYQMVLRRPFAPNRLLIWFESWWLGKPERMIYIISNSSNSSVNPLWPVDGRREQSHQDSNASSRNKGDQSFVLICCDPSMPNHSIKAFKAEQNHQFFLSLICILLISTNCFNKAIDRS